VGKTDIRLECFVVAPENSLLFGFSATEIIFYGRYVICQACAALAINFQINRLKLRWNPYFKRYSGSGRNTIWPFSFFRSTFLEGTKCLEKGHQASFSTSWLHKSKQRHSLDCFFELTYCGRVLIPLVHVYQNRVPNCTSSSRCKSGKTQKSGAVSIVVGRSFSDQHISFISIFITFIKKNEIVMLQKIQLLLWLVSSNFYI